MLSNTPGLHWEMCFWCFSHWYTHGCPLPSLCAISLLFAVCVDGGNLCHFGLGSTVGVGHAWWGNTAWTWELEPAKPGTFSKASHMHLPAGTTSSWRRPLTDSYLQVFLCKKQTKPPLVVLRRLWEKASMQTLQIYIHWYPQKIHWGLHFCKTYQQYYFCL